MTRSQSIRFVGGLTLLALVMAAQALMPSAEDSSLMTGTILDAGHVPLFSVFALLVLWLSRSTVPGTGARHYVVAFVLVVIAGLGTEFIQKFGARDAGWGDFIRDLLGGASALLAAWAIGDARGIARVIALLLAVGLFGAGVAEVGFVYRDYRGRDASFPALAGFDAAWEPRFVHGHDSRLELVATNVAPGRVGKVSFGRAAYPSLAIHEPYPDWSGFGAMEFVVHNPGTGPVDLTLRIHDTGHDDTYADRFNRLFSIEPGTHRFSVPVDQIVTGPRDRELDIASVRGIAFFLDHPQDDLELWFDEIGLIR